jgi:hypothetical protein
MCFTWTRRQPQFAGLVRLRGVATVGDSEGSTEWERDGVPALPHGSVSAAMRYPHAWDSRALRTT